MSAARYVPSGEFVAVKRALLDKSQSNLDSVQVTFEALENMKFECLVVIAVLIAERSC